MARKPAPIEVRRKKFVIAILRRASLRWPERNEALKNARVNRGQYKCASCKELFGRTAVAVDHIKPVIDIKEGQQSIDIYAERLFCEAENLQALCHPCHDSKSRIENEMRDYYKQKKKIDKSKKK
jgi:5-methylcytosine-specific restriction endonuclease McrA